MADAATVTIFNVDDNSTLLPATNMTAVSPGIFVLNYSFPSVGNFVALQNCYFPLNITAQGSDDVTVTEPLATFILPAIGIVLLIFGGRRKTFMFFAGVVFLLPIIIVHTSVILTLIFFFLGVGCFFEAARLHMGKGKTL